MSGWTLLFQVVNFLVLAALLRRFLFKPVMAMVAKRQQEIERATSEGERLRHDAAEIHAGAEAALAMAAQTRDRALSEARAQAEREREAALAETRREAQTILDEAKRDVEVEREKAAETLAGAAVTIAAALAGRLVGQMITAPIADAFLARLCEDLDRLSEERKRALREDLGVQDLVIATAPPLAPDAASRWRGEIVSRLWPGLSLRAVGDESLVAGAELRFPHATIAFCWRDAIQAARKEMVA